MRKTRVRVAVVLVGTGIGLAYLLTGLFLFYLLPSFVSAYGLLPAALLMIPAFLLSIVVAVAISIPVQLLGAFLVSHGIRNAAASPFWDSSPEGFRAQ